MSKGLRSFPEAQRRIVAQRRAKAYDPKGANGLGTLGARDFLFARGHGKAVKQEKKSNG